MVRIHMETVSSVNGAGKLDSYMQKNDIRTFCSHHLQKETQNELKMYMEDWIL